MMHGQKNINIYTYIFLSLNMFVKLGFSRDRKNND